MSILLMGFNVLVCDDSALARKMAKRNLPAGFADTTLEASNGMEGLDILTNHTVDLVLLDLTMPIMSGLEVLSEIKRRKIKTFVVVVSGDIQPLMQEKVMSLGALGFIEKPIKQELLYAILRRFGFILPETNAAAIAF